MVLAATTREDAAGDFGGLENVPTEAITMGVATILAAQSVVLMAWGERKAPTVAAALEGPRTAEVPASFLRGHGDTRVVLDKGAASSLQKKGTSKTATVAAMRKSYVLCGTGRGHRCTTFGTRVPIGRGACFARVI